MLKIELLMIVGYLYLKKGEEVPRDSLGRLAEASELKDGKLNIDITKVPNDKVARELGSEIDIEYTYSPDRIYTCKCRFGQFKVNDKDKTFNFDQDD